MYISNQSLNFFILHDIFDYHIRYELLALHLLNRLPHNSTITLIDFRGHGHSSGFRKGIDKFDDYLCDTMEIINIVCDKFRHEKVSKKYVFGQGLGGLVVLMLNYLKKFKLDGMIIANPILKFSKLFNIGIENSIFKKNILLFRKLRTKYDLVGSDFCNGEDLAWKFDNDPLIQNFITYGLLNEITKTSKLARQSSYYIDRPSLFLFSGEDHIVDNRIGRIFAQGMESKLCTITEFPESYHDLVNDLRCDKVYDEISNWVKKNNDK